MIIQTSLGALTIEQAKPDELRVVIDIIDEAAAWLHAKDITKQWPSPTPQSFAEFMEKQIARDNVYLARRDYFITQKQPSTVAGQLSRPIEDVYVLLTGWEGASATFKVYINPLINWVWLGGLVMTLGTLLAAWPEASAHKRWVMAATPVPAAVGK